ncbi:helix-turn-helix domain-containing protein [Albimonas sp. CAU 1670]|uniref:AraC family transcriptional regulator n=1 Tax=Albimonas sp. CAU 1670 TaxID=3032599 RepID=UPI0023DBF227|nr:helix-turn-helix domain-containing protein [Albimonas sp. CAU 1670]MDF2235751.1 helix-turn-helix domain-containing protein [Albimonas sp. CAU 1670]
MIAWINGGLYAESSRLLAAMTTPRLAEELAQAAGLPPDPDGPDPAFVPYAAYAGWAERAARRLGERHFGAVLGVRHRYEDLGPYADYVLQAPSLLRAVARARRALPLIANASRVEMVARDGRLVVRFRSGVERVVGARHVDEFMPPLIVQLFARFQDEGWRPDWIELPAAGGRLDADIADLLGGIPLRAADAPGVALRAEALQARNNRRPDPRQALVFRDLPALAGGRAPMNFGEATRAAIRLDLRLGEASAETVAERLGLGLRTFQRRLRAEGLSFRDLRLEETLARGLALLTETDLPVETVAESLGYDDPSSFRRAFRRRFDHPPSLARANPLAEAPKRLQ